LLYKKGESTVESRYLEVEIFTAVNIWILWVVMPCSVYGEGGSDTFLRNVSNHLLHGYIQKTTIQTKSTVRAPP
jgi:hypothetical protein